MRFVTVAIAMIFALAVQGATLVAQGWGNGHVKTMSVSTPKVTPPTQNPKHAAAKRTTANVKLISEIETPAGKADTRAIGADTKFARQTRASTVAAPPPTLTTTVISPETPTTHSVKNPKLEARLLTMLPAGTNVHDASQGFKNWGQFVAAVHVAHNLSIPFADLKAKITRFTPGTVPGTVAQTASMSLAQAIQSLKGTQAGISPAKIQAEVKKAENAANTALRLSRETN
jgi:hypothetical protein